MNATTAFFDVFNVDAATLCRHLTGGVAGTLLRQRLDEENGGPVWFLTCRVRRTGQRIYLVATAVYRGACADAPTPVLVAWSTSSHEARERFFGPVF